MDNIGILDPDGKNTNPLTDKEYSNKYIELSKLWRNFPAYKQKDKILENLDKSQVNIIISGTGSGKTVLIPKFLLHNFNYNKKIAITLPKQIIAKSSAEFSALTLDVELGKEVGYKYRGSSKNMYSDNTKLLYATDGTIVSMLMNDIRLPEFDGVIIDEAHERKVQIDFLLYLLKQTVSLRDDFKLVIMSATINTDLFKNYYMKHDPIITELSGDTYYPIETIYTDEIIPVDKIKNKGIEIIKDIINKTDKGDILFFVNSSFEAKEICKQFEKSEETYCIEVYSGMDEKKQMIAQHVSEYKNINGYKRKLVIATNVAESSLTIDGIDYVIDSGYELTSYFDPEKRAKVLDKQRISKAQIEQRRGRTGRTAPGTCYHLYPKKILDEVPKFPLPAIRKEDITQECLRIMAYPNVQTYDKLLDVMTNLIEPPLEKYLTYSGDRLSEIGAMKNKKITNLGNILSSINMDLKYSIMFLLAKQLKCTIEVLKIISMIDACKNNMKELFMDPTSIISQDDENRDQKIKSLNKKFEKARDAFKNKYGDHLSLLKIFDKFEKLYKKKDFKTINQKTFKYFLKESVLNKAYRNFKRNRSLIYRIEKYDFKIDDEVINMDLKYKILYCIGVGSYDKTNTYTNVDMSKYTLLSKKPNNFMYDELFILMGKQEINIVSLIPDKLKNFIIKPCLKIKE